MRTARFSPLPAIARPVRRRHLRTSSVVAASTLLAVLTSGVAFASWTSPGSGSGTAAAGTSIALVTAIATTPTAGLLYPGGPAAELRLTVVNANTYPVSVSGIAANGAVTATGGLGACTTTGVSLLPPTAGLPILVPAKVGAVDGTITVTLTGATQMSSAAENGCQGATFTVPLILTGVSATP